MGDIIGEEKNILSIELISFGAPATELIEPMEVYSLAVTKRANSIIVVQHFPDGTIEPRTDDKELTDRLYQSGIILNTTLEDHLLISDEGYTSLNESGYLFDISKSSTWKTPYKIRSKWRLEGREIGKKEGIEVKLISELTGMLEFAIGKLKIE